MSYSRYWQLLKGLLAALMMLALVGSDAIGQQYKAAPYDKQSRFLKSVAQRCVRDANFYDASDENRTQFEKYFKGYYFPMITRPSPEGLGQMGKLSNDLFRSYLWPSKSQSAQRDLTETAYEFFRRVMANPEFHPAVRLNSALILGKLDAQYAAESGGARRPPRPYPDSVKLLIQVVENAGKVRWITPSIVSASLSGLERHARYHDQLPASITARLEKTLLSVVTRAEPFKGVDLDVDFWIRRQAATGLANLGSAGEGNRVLEGLVNLLGNEDMALDGRCAIAGLLSDISVDGVQVNAQTIVAPVILLSADVAAEAAEKAEEFGEQRMRRGGRAIRGQGQLEFGRRRLITWLDQLDDGLVALQPAVDNEANQAIADIVSAMSIVRSAARDDNTIDLELVEDVQRMASDIEQVASAWRTPAADATTAEADSDEFVK